MTCLRCILPAEKKVILLVSIPHGPARPNIDNPYFTGVANEIPGADARMVIRQRILQIILHQHQFGW